MAIEYGWTGFESGEADSCVLAPGRGAIIGVRVNAPHTGVYCLSVLIADSTPNVWTAYRRKNTAIGALGTPQATTKARVFFRLNTNVDVDSSPIFNCGTLSTAGQRGNLQININRTFRAFAIATSGASSTAVLSLDTWYRADLTHTVTDLGATVQADCSVSVYDDAGVLIETVSRTSTTAVANAELPSDVAMGNGGAGASNYDIDFDDLWWGSADGADIASLAFPTTAMRVTRVPATAQGSLAQWTGDFRLVTEFPRESATEDAQSNAVAGQQTTFTKPTASSLGISGIEGVIVRAQLRSVTSSGNESLLLGGVSYTVPVTTAYANLGKDGVTYAPISNATFDGWEFGARNDRGTGLRLATCYLEVLHSGNGPTTPYADVSDTFRLNLITYTGNGGYQTVSGMGFGSQAILGFPVNAVSSSGGVYLTRLGGTFFLTFEPGGSRRTNNILSVTDDGFTLGPNTFLNASGVTYLAIGIRDGGQGSGGFHFSTLSRPGQFSDNYNVAFKEPFQPDLALDHCAQSGSPIFRSSAMVGDLSVSLPGLSTVTNEIQALNGSGFQVGSASPVATINLAHMGLIMRIGTGLTTILHVGTLTPGGSSATITGIPFTPVFVCCQRQGSSTTGFWRSSLTHTGTVSTSFSTGADNASTAITSITADGFTIGSALATAGTPVHWFALAPGSIPQGGCVVTLSNGVDSGGSAGCRVSLAS